MHIRPALPEDAGAIAVMEAAAADHPWTEGQVAGTLAEAHGHAWIAEDDRGPVGHLVGQLVLDEAELLTIAVLPRARRAGVGRALIGRALAEWTARGAAVAFLEVRADNAPAARLYDATGWEPCGRRRGYYAQGTVDAILFRRTLSAG